MAETKIKILFNDRLTDASDVPILQSNEDWREYKLEDGTTLRARFAVASVARVAGEYDPEGNPIYVVKGTLLTNTLLVPDNLRKKP